MLQGFEKHASHPGLCALAHACRILCPMQFQIDEEVTLRKLEILLAFMEAGSMSRAGEMLGISPVSVHRALHSLERGVRCPLFRQDGRNLLPTDAAQSLADVVPRARWLATQPTASASGRSIR
jgi:LysR family malonate utilization transcriptional regulator